MNLGIQVATCVWGDNDSLGVVMFFFKSVDQVKADFITARGQIETK